MKCPHDNTELELAPEITDPCTQNHIEQCPKCKKYFGISEVDGRILWERSKLLDENGGK